MGVAPAGPIDGSRFRQYPGRFDATDIGVLLPDGRVFYCHDTTDPIVFDPRTGNKVFPGASGSLRRPPRTIGLISEISGG